MNERECGRKRSCSILSAVPAFVYKDWGKPWQCYVLADTFCIQITMGLWLWRTLIGRRVSTYFSKGPAVSIYRVMWQSLLFYIFSCIILNVMRFVTQLIACGMRQLENRVLGKLQGAAERSPLIGKLINSKPKKIRQIFFYFWEVHRMPF